MEEEEAYRVARAAIGTPTGTYTVLVAQSLESVDESTAAVLPLLAIGYPILVLVVAVSTYWLVGRSLQPVEAIRAKVAAIGGRQLTERVPVPAAQDEIGRLAVTMNGMLGRLERLSSRSGGSSPTPATSCAARSPRSRRWGRRSSPIPTGRSLGPPRRLSSRRRHGWSGS